MWWKCCVSVCKEQTFLTSCSTGPLAPVRPAPSWRLLANCLATSTSTVHRSTILLRSLRHL
uniref:(California timema) hypothetical protein n=1 Tax=Timema californicum TaxID=61474 RepID=A0A7R9PES1_TIMCA|nr:unnamed protein product [Timema californicum]